MGNLGDEQGACAVRDVGAKAHDEATDEIHGITVDMGRLRGKSLEKRTEDNKDAAGGCTLLATESIGNVWGKEEDKEAAQSGNGTEDSKAVSCRIVEIWGVNFTSCPRH